MSNNNSFKSFGNYRIISEIGSGGFGNVYKAEHTILIDRIVAIKQLHTHLSSIEERERFLQEARLLERLKHPYILHIFDVGIDDGFPYLIAEYAPNGSLRARIQKYLPNPLPSQEALTILSQVGKALSHAHQQHIIHRDLKPENILFNANNDALLADFGIATTLATASVKSVTITGTPLYMAPEQFQSSVSRESDQYALACIAYELFTGHPPFTAADFFALGFSHLTQPPTPPTHFNPHLPIHIEQAILKAMAKQRSDRYADIKAFIMALHSPAPSRPTLTATNIQPPSPFYHHEPITPLPPTSPSFSHITDPEHPHYQHIQPTITTPRLTTTHEQLTSYNKGPVTPLPLATTRFQEEMTILPSIGRMPTMATPSLPWNEQASPYSTISASSPQPTDQTSWPIDNRAYYDIRPIPEAMQTQLLPTSRTTRRHARRKWPFIAIASLLVIASLLGTFFFVFSPGRSPLNSLTTTSQIMTTTQAAPLTGTPEQISSHRPSPGPGGNPSNKPTYTPTAIATHTLNTPTTIATYAPVLGVTPTPTPTSPSAPTPTPTFTPTPTPTPTPPPVTETVTAYFTSGTNGITTTNSFSGTVTVNVTGTGQASNTQYSDAFYRYTDSSGNQISEPSHPSCWVMYINGQPTDNFTSIPTYNSTHSYTFTMTAPGGQLTFGVCDDATSDNTGSYTITVTQG